MIRWSPIFAILGGVAYLLLHALIETYFPDHWAGSPNRLLGFSYASWSRLLWIPEMFFLLALPGLYARVSAFVGRSGRLGIILAAIGLGLEILGSLIEFWIFGLLAVPITGEFRTGSTGSQLGYSVASIGAWTLMFGLLFLGIAGLRSSLPARWRIILISLALVNTSILVFYFVDLLALHAILYGLTWVILGVVHWNEMSLRATEARNAGR